MQRDGGVEGIGVDVTVWRGGAVGRGGGRGRRGRRLACLVRVGAHRGLHERRHVFAAHHLAWHHAASVRDGIALVALAGVLFVLLLFIFHLRHQHGRD